MRRFATSLVPVVFVLSLAHCASDVCNDAGCPNRDVQYLVDAGTSPDAVAVVDAIPALDAPPAIDVVTVTDAPAADLVQPRDCGAPGCGEVRSVGVGIGHICVVFADGSLWCWGGNDSGQLGDGSSVPSPGPEQNPYVTNAVAVAAAGTHSCAILADSSVVCWGLNDAGQSGVPVTGGGARDVVSAPRRVSGLGPVTQLALGRAHSCALVTDGSVWCWGGNPNGELGTVGAPASYQPVRVPVVANVIQIASLMSTVCAVERSGSVVCWGSNQSGSVGDGSTSYASPPVSARGITTATAVHTGEGHTCALEADHSVWCWGSNRFGAVGADGGGALPAIVAGLSTVEQISTAQEATCVRRNSGPVQCWGTLNTNVGPVDTSIAPVSGTEGAIDLVAGEFSVCVRLADGGLACWGDHALTGGDTLTAARIAFP